MDDYYENFANLLKELKSKFKIDSYKSVSLYTIRHFDKKAISTIQKNNTVLLEQISKETVQMVIQ